MLNVLVGAALRTLLLAALVKLGLWLLRIKRAQLLLLAWTVILSASLAMPALQLITPIRLPLVPDLLSPAMIDAADPLPPPSVSQTPEQAIAAEIPDPPGMKSWLEAAYLLVSGILLLRLAVGVALSLRLVNKATSVRLAWAGNAQVRISRWVTAPVTVANVILLPFDAVDWPSPMRDAVLAHEQAHVARWDFAMLLVSQVNRALFWFSPLSWWLHRRLAALAELASDDHAIGVIGDRSGYAAVLLEMGRRPGPLLRGLAMARPASLTYRIERILTNHVLPAPVSPVQQMLLALGAAGLSIAVASSNLQSASLSDVVALTAPRIPPAPLEAIALPSAQAAADAPKPVPVPLPQPRTEPALEAPQHPAPFGSPDRPKAISRPRPMVRTVARALSSPTVSTSLAAQSVPGERLLNSVSNGPLPLVPQTSASAEPANSNDEGAQELRPAPVSNPTASLPASEHPILKLINDQTCSGVYMPQRAAGVTDGRHNLVRAKLFQDASGAPWLTFFLDGQTPVIQPVTMTHAKDKHTAAPDVVFTMVPASARHLDGFLKRLYGTIDFDCGGANKHIFDGGG